MNEKAVAIPISSYFPFIALNGRNVMFGNKEADIVCSRYSYLCTFF